MGVRISCCRENVIEGQCLNCDIYADEKGEDAMSF